MNKQDNKQILEIKLGDSFWFGISFTAGCFGFGWIPFVVIVIFSLFSHEKLNNEYD